MKTLERILQGTGKLTLAILGCLLMPVLIWVGLGAAIHQKNQVNVSGNGADFARVPPLRPGK